MSGPQSVVVPVEPTPKMMAATWDHEIDKSGGIESQNTRNARIWTAMLAAAPAPSSLAGGEDDFAHDLARTLDRYGLKDAGWSDADIADALEMVGEPSGVSQATVKAIMPMIEARLAALSPEAPAREGCWIEAAKRPDTTGDLWLAVDAAGKLFPGVFVNHRIPAEAALVQRVVLPGQVALTPRHEAPASEGDAS